LGAQQTGYILAYLGIVLVIMQGGLIGPLSARFKESSLIVTFLGFTLVGMLGWTFSQSIPMLLVAMFPMAVGAGSFNALINSAISKAVTRDEVGGMLGLGAGLESATRVVMPALASFLLGAYGTSTPGAMGSVVLAIVLVYAFINLRPQTADRKER
jgi:MFS family permease